MKTQFAAAIAAGLALAASAPAAFAGTLEDAVLEEINFARTQPQAYARELEAYRAEFEGRIWRDPEGGPGAMTNEGTRAVDEAIAVMRRQRPLPALERHAALFKAANDHARDTGPSGVIGHRGADRSMPESRINRYGAWRSSISEAISYGHANARDVVRQLIVDDGVRDRAHRASLLNPNLKLAGVGCGRHRVYRAMCVIDFAVGMDRKRPDEPQGVSYYSLAGR